MRRYTADDIRYTVGQNIMAARKKRGLSQSQLSSLAGMNSGKYAAVQISNIENGMNFPYLVNLAGIADALGVDVFSFFKKLDQEENMDVKIRIVGNGMMPEYKRNGDACLDCHARLGADRIRIPAHSRCLVSLGFCLELPDGWEAVIRPRSGLSASGIDNAIGTVDSSYRGEVKACVINNTDGAFDIADGDRICQLAIRRAERVNLVQVDELSDTERGESGFGSTGV